MRADAVLLLILCLSATLRADVLVRWNQEEIPPPTSLGITRIAVPSSHSTAIENAVRQGYDVFLEHTSERRVVPRNSPSGSSKERVLDIESRGKWPHIRTNWVTRNNAVLQVAGRSAQPWIDTNAALLRIIDQSRSLLTYPWKPITLSEVDEGPGLENYLVAIAEAGSFGGSLLLPLHDRFEKDLLLGKPQARAWWSEIRRYIEFYSWNLPARYRSIANIGVVTADPTRWYEIMNLLARHNLPFELIAPTALAARDLSPFKLLIVPGEPPSRPRDELAEFERKGGLVVTPRSVGDPNRFALDIRQKLGRDHRVIDIWNGITVVAAPYQEPDGTGVLVTAINYAHQPLPVQMRVRGTFSLVHYESPETPLTLLPYEHRDGCTEFVVPGLRIGGRIFLSEPSGPK